MIDHYCFRMVPDCGLATKHESGVKGKKVRVTYAFTTNADGSEKLPPFIIGKAKNPCCFRKKTGKQLGFLYRNNTKAWMTGTLYQEWIENWDKELRRTGRHILLFQDNFKGHIVPETLTHIRVVNFEPNLTAHVQPADAGIIRCFKAHYRAHFIQRAIERYDSGTTPSEIYDIDQLSAMRLADEAWSNVSQKTIANCWRKAGILPPSLFRVPAYVNDGRPFSHTASPVLDTDPSMEAEKELTEALDDLVLRGALQKSNRMDLGDFVEPDDEDGIDGDGDAVQDIFEAVMEAHEAMEMIEINGGDDHDTGNVRALPSLLEVLESVDVLKTHLSDVNEPFARQLEVLLGKASRHVRAEQSRNLRETSIMDYFARK
jgi:hypothetical protein